MTGNLGRNHGSNSKQLAAHSMRLYSSNKINLKTNYFLCQGENLHIKFITLLLVTNFFLRKYIFVDQVSCFDIKFLIVDIKFLIVNLISSFLYYYSMECNFSLAFTTSTKE